MIAATAGTTKCSTAIGWAMACQCSLAKSPLSQRHLCGSLADALTLRHDLCLPAGLRSSTGTTSCCTCWAARGRCPSGRASRRERALSCTRCVLLCCAALRCVMSAMAVGLPMGCLPVPRKRCAVLGSGLCFTRVVGNGSQASWPALTDGHHTYSMHTYSMQDANVFASENDAGVSHDITLAAGRQVRARWAVPLPLDGIAGGQLPQHRAAGLPLQYLPALPHACSLP